MILLPEELRSSGSVFGLIAFTDVLRAAGTRIYLVPVSVFMGGKLMVVGSWLMSETRRYLESHDQIVLTSHVGTERRQLHRQVDGTWVMNDPSDKQFQEDDSLDGWKFQQH
ncbi:hypothetical protein [Planctopirus hydrillae]|uniref:Uncharacterized protein n=1 Tax=Planctopirus hydrillae TaxID=1841610 RepID=A0A1C3EAP3_9PLAN|nr:hypothetical protein [Planctopirus hydrillae]ODA30327.1 hypothetical protein A6X21_00105 [Planctopirus hydrillae]